MKAETTSLDEQGKVELPEAIRVAAHLAPQAIFTIEVAQDGSIILRPVRDPEQAWFWTEEWQAGEREADAQMAAGRGVQYESGEGLLKALRERRKRRRNDADV